MNTAVTFQPATAAGANARSSGSTGTGAAPELSVIIPVFNEEDSLDRLYDKMCQAMTPLKKTWELILVDDGSRDRSFEILQTIAARDKRVKVVRFVRNFGQ